jgi:hypothetical protein
MVRSSHSTFSADHDRSSLLQNDASGIKQRDDVGIAQRHSISKICTKGTLINGQRSMPNRVNQFRFANCPEKTLDQASRTLWPREPIYLRPDYDSFLTVPRRALRCARKGTVDKR